MTRFFLPWQRITLSHVWRVSGKISSARKKLILLEDEHCFREQALSLCKSHSMQEDKAFQATSLETIRHVVAAGQGVTLMPGIARRYNDGVAYIPMAGKHYSRTIGAVWKKGHVRAPFFRAFAALLAIYRKFV
jgi:LysR family hydrogen peroxide-inducible transcriptional activator